MGGGNTRAPPRAPPAAPRHLALTGKHMNQNKQNTDSPEHYNNIYIFTSKVKADTQCFKVTKKTALPYQCDNVFHILYSTMW